LDSIALTCSGVMQLQGLFNRGGLGLTHQSLTKLENP